MSDLVFNATKIPSAAVKCSNPNGRPPVSVDIFWEFTGKAPSKFLWCYTGSTRQEQPGGERRTGTIIPVRKSS